MLLFNFEGACPPRKAKEKTERTLRWGCSSAGRAPALQAGVMGSNPIISTKSVKRTKKKEAEENGSGREAYGLIAQVVRARA